MPINHAYPIEEVIKAIDYYIEKTNRKVTIEYILKHHIREKQRPSHVTVHVFLLHQQHPGFLGGTVTYRVRSSGLGLGWIKPIGICSDCIF